MRLEVLRMLSDWLNDDENGVVAKLAAIPVDVGDSLPDVGTIADSTRNALVAQGRFPSVPGIAINVNDIKYSDGEVVTIDRGGVVSVLIRIGRAATDTGKADTDSSYIERAVVDSLRAFSAASQTRNQVQVYACTNLGHHRIWTTDKDVIVTGAVAGDFQCRDTAPG